MHLKSINIGKARTHRRNSRIETTGIYKLPAEGPVRIELLGLSGDTIVDRKHHGGPDQAVYVYGGADYAWWSKELGREIAPGTFGENLTIADLESGGFNVGDDLIVGEVTLQVTAPRIPCGTFATRMGDPQWVKKFRKAERFGLYCRVLRQGVVQAGDPVSIEKYRGLTLSIVEMARDFYETELSEAQLRRHLEAPIDIRSRRDIEAKLLKRNGG
ncbi:MAG TPA: MOSC domain-containing protein [Anaerolineales bacterium]|nr:MOSC domain-containing protein [Anaerolineales bacterium]